MCLSLAARSAHSDEQGLGADRPGGHRGLGLDLVAGVDHGQTLARTHRGLLQAVEPVLGRDEVVDDVHLRRRVDLQDALAHSLDLSLAVGGSQGVDLAVGVGLADVVEVDQRDATDSTARKGLSRPGSDAAYADDDSMRIEDALGTLDAVEAAQAAKAALESLVGLAHDHCMRARRSRAAMPASVLG